MSPPSLSQRRDMFELSISSPRTAGCVASDVRRICANVLTAAVAREFHSFRHDFFFEYSYAGYEGWME